MELVRAHTGSGEPDLGRELVIGERAVRVDCERIWLAPVGPIEVIPYDEPQRFGVARARVALVGAWGGSVDLHRGPEGAAYGVELLAALVQTILSGSAPVPFGPRDDALLATVLGLAAWAGASFDRRSVGVVGAITVVACAWLVHDRVLPSLLPPLAAVAAGAWSARREIRSS